MFLLKRGFTFTVLAAALLCSPAAGAQEPEAARPTAAPAVPLTVRSPLRATGIVQRVEDGELVIRLELTAEQRANVLRLPGLENGIPSTTGRLGVHKGEVFVRYLLAPGAELERAAIENLGKKVHLELDTERRVTGLARAAR